MPAGGGRMIGVDWGTTNVRAFRFADDGQVLATRSAPRGIATLRHDEIEGALADLVWDWLPDEQGILLAGMVGSRSGWVETAYLPCPVDPHLLGAALVNVDTGLARCRIVPGVATAPGALPDVMRGEETQLLGAGVHDGRCVLPGTHSKWATLADGQITGIQTFITGELYALLLDHALIGQLATEAAAVDDAAFAQGVAASLSQPSLATTLFSARAGVLLGQLAAGGVRDYISGLLIGAEIAVMVSPGERLTIIGAERLAARYRTALAIAGVVDVATVDGADAAAKGLWMIGMVRP